MGTIMLRGKPFFSEVNVTAKLKSVLESCGFSAGENLSLEHEREMLPEAYTVKISNSCDLNIYFCIKNSRKVAVFEIYGTARSFRNEEIDIDKKIDQIKRALYGEQTED